MHSRIRGNTVYVSKEDKEKILKNCAEIKKILDKYPASYDYSESIIPTMMHVKIYFRDFYKWASSLDTKEDAEYNYHHFCERCPKTQNNICIANNVEKCDKIKQSILEQINEDSEGRSIIERMVLGI